MIVTSAKNEQKQAEKKKPTYTSAKKSDVAAIFRGYLANKGVVDFFNKELVTDNFVDAVLNNNLFGILDKCKVDLNQIFDNEKYDNLYRFIESIRDVDFAKSVVRFKIPAEIFYEFGWRTQRENLKVYCKDEVLLSTFERFSIDPVYLYKCGYTDVIGNIKSSAKDDNFLNAVERFKISKGCIYSNSYKHQRENVKSVAGNKLFLDAVERLGINTQILTEDDFSEARKNLASMVSVKHAEDLIKTFEKLKTEPKALYHKEYNYYRNILTEVFNGEKKAPAFKMIKQFVEDSASLKKGSFKLTQIDRIFSNPEVAEAVIANQENKDVFFASEKDFSEIVAKYLDAKVEKIKKSYGICEEIGVAKQ